LSSQSSPGGTGGQSPLGSDGGPNALRPQKVATLLAQRIVKDIIDSGLQPGAKLVPEHEMIRNYGVGRGTVREALRYLELEGVLTIRPGPGGGPVVADPGGNNFASLLSLLLALSRRPFEDVVGSWEAFGPAMAAGCAVKATPEDIEALRTSVEAISTAKGGDDFLEAYRAFHDRIAEGADNHVYLYLLTSLRSLMESVGIRYATARRKAVVESSRAILDAIEARDPGAARSAMERHLGEWANYVRRRHGAEMNKPVGWGRQSQ